MAIDVSDEALEKMAREFTRAMYGVDRVASTEALLPLLTRIRDLTAASAIEIARDCETRGLNVELHLEHLFPGAAAAEGEARDDKQA